MKEVAQIMQRLGFNKGVCLRDVFIHGGPVREDKYFYPRNTLSDRLIELLREPDKQIIVFGEGYVGKTSLVLYCLRRLGYPAPFHLLCFEGITADLALRQLMRMFNISRLQNTKDIRKTTVGGHASLATPLPVNAGIGGQIQQEESCEKTTTQWTEAPSIYDLVQAMKEESVILFIDDAEKISDVELIAILRNGAKHLATHSLNPSNKMIISMAYTEIKEFQSQWKPKDNRFAFLEVPRMKNEEIRGLIHQGQAFTCLRLDDDVVEEIVLKSNGIPARAQLMCLECGRFTARNNNIESFRLTGQEVSIGIDVFRTNILKGIDENYVW